MQRYNTVKKQNPIPALFLVAAVLGAIIGVVIGLPQIVGGQDGLSRTVSYPWNYSELIADACKRHDVDPYMVCAIIKCESNWREDAVSAAGAIGLMQIMPQTAQSLVDLGLVDGATFDPSNLSNPQTNIEYGCAYLAFLQRELATEEEIIAAYNAGIGNVTAWKQNQAEGEEFADVIAFSETRAYLSRVQEAKQAYQELYPQAPGI